MTSDPSKLLRKILEQQCSHQKPEVFRMDIHSSPFRSELLKINLKNPDVGTNSLVQHAVVQLVQRPTFPGVANQSLHRHTSV